MAGKTDWNRISLFLMAVLLILIVTLMYWHQKTIQEQHDAEHHRVSAQFFVSITSSVQQTFSHWQEQLKLISHHPETVDLALSKETLVTRWQQHMSSLMPDVENICFIKVLPETPTDTGCLKLNFASLTMLRKLEQGQPAEMVFIDNGDRYLLMADAVKPNGDDFAGVVVLTIPVRVIDKLLQQTNVAQGYLQLTQGDAGNLLVSHHGNARLKQGENTFEKPLKNSFMRLSFWSQPSHFATNWILYVAAIVLVITVWLLQLIWLKKLLREDSKTLLEQISDLQNMALKLSYPLHIDAFNLVSDALQRLAMRQRNDQMEARYQSGQAGYHSPADSVVEENEQLDQQLPIESRLDS